MSQNLFVLTTGTLTTLAILCAQTPASAQTAPAPTRKTWTPPHAPDGHPDLQGYWTNSTETPLERPKGLGTKEFYTEAELAELMKKDANRVALNKEEGRPTEPGTTADVHYDYTQFGLDRGQAKLSWSRRTSMIVGERGTLPPMLPEARKRNADIAAKRRGHELDGPEGLGLSARCIVVEQESVPMLPRRLQQQSADCPGSESCGHSKRDEPLRPHRPH